MLFRGHVYLRPEWAIFYKEVLQCLKIAIIQYFLFIFLFSFLFLILANFINARFHFSVSLFCLMRYEISANRTIKRYFQILYRNRGHDYYPPPIDTPMPSISYWLLSFHQATCIIYWMQNRIELCVMINYLRILFTSDYIITKDHTSCLQWTSTKVRPKLINFLLYNW